MKTFENPAVRYTALFLILAAGLESPAANRLGPNGAVPGSDDGHGYLQAYAEVLTWVNDQGLVDYQALKARRQLLDRLAVQFENLDRSVYDSWNRVSQIAFWINAYNALTLLAIVDNYPIQSSFLASLRFPKNSIRQIPGVWDELEFVVMGESVTLDEIEHRVLRQKFDEPRIHMALVCAAKSCPPLRSEPYTGSRLEEQLDDQSRRFVSTPGKFRISRADKSVFISKIFQWYGDDFIKQFGNDKRFGQHSQKERAVLSFISRFMRDDNVLYLSEGSFSVKYLDYDWTLNDISLSGKLQ